MIKTNTFCCKTEAIKLL